MGLKGESRSGARVYRMLQEKIAVGIQDLRGQKWSQEDSQLKFLNVFVQLQAQQDIH